MFPLPRVNRMFRRSILLALLLSSPVDACTTPVFRYALENWPASPFEVSVFHRGPLSAEQQALVRRLSPEGPKANVRVRSYDVAGDMPPSARKLWEQSGKQALPCVVVQYPEEARESPAFVGPLGDGTADMLLDSPARRELVRRLGAGDAAVWIVLGAAKEPAFLEGELARLQKDIVLPEPDPAFPLLSALPLKLRFSVLRLDRDDPKEAFLVRSLLGSADGLSEAKGPIVFPVFGRGRVLVGIHGKQSTAANVERWASFLCGACSCRVKESNPGIDLLLRADWETLLDIPDTPPDETAAVPIPPGGTAPEKESASPSDSLAWLWVVLGVAGVGALGTSVRLLRPRSSFEVLVSRCEDLTPAPPSHREGGAGGMSDGVSFRPDTVLLPLPLWEGVGG